MIVEALAYLLERATPHARRRGYVHEQIALLARHRRHRKIWAPHLERTRRYILRAAAEAKGGLAVILGSGALLDVPLESLAARFGQVVLVDVFHPWRARRMAKRFANVRLVTHDLLADAPLGHSLATLRTDGWRIHAPDPDFVVSANLLSQLPVLPLQRAEHGADAELAWMQAVIRAHLRDLAAGPGRACVISENIRRQLDRQGTEIDSHDGLAGVALPEPEETWEWEVVPFGEIDRDSRTIVAVNAFRLPPEKPA